MQNQSPFSTPPPIPMPDGNFSPRQQSTNVVRGDWANAPGVVKGWAYVLTWLNIVFTPLIMAVGFFDDKSKMDEKIGVSLFLGIIWVAAIWLNRAMKKGSPAAWTAQIIFSAIGLLGFPIGTAINIYILSQWFKPEIKAWFGKS